ncbi:MAG TPA: TetR/AcrR family transcriptional regulator [Mucilaginibacter sp.]
MFYIYNVKFMPVSTPIKEDDIQAQILQAAKHLFQVYGFRKVTIDDIAKAIGKARSSLYYYYKTKEEILDAVIAAEIRELLAAIVAAVNQAQGAELQIKAFFITKLQVISKKRTFFNSLDAGMDAQEMSSYNKTRISIHQHIIQREGALLNQIISDGISKEELKPLNKTEKEDLIFVLLSCLHGIKREMVIKDDFSGISSSVNILTRSVIHGLKN